MEVFLGGLPRDLTSRSLHSQLEPYMQRHRILYYGCEKRKTQVYGFITFYHQEDGELFLYHHGEASTGHDGSHRSHRAARNRPGTSRLTIMRCQVQCRPGNYQPSDLKLRSVKHEVDQRLAKPQQVDQASISLAPDELSCGHCLPDGGRGDFTFVSEWSHVRSYSAIFAKRSLVLNLQANDAEVKVRIPYHAIVELVWSDRGTIVVVLASPPTFLRSPDLADMLLATSLGGPARHNAEKRLRVPAIDRDHERISSYCLAYHISVSQVVIGGAGVAKFHDTIMKIKEKEAFDVSHSNIVYQRAGAPGGAFPTFPDAITGLKAQLEQYTQEGILPFSLLFLLQRLVYNGYLHPSTVLGVAARCASLFSAARQQRDSDDPISVDTFKKLFHWIEFSTTFADHRCFTVDGIMAYLDTTEADIRKGLLERSELFNETQSLTRIFRATVTPTRITFHGPELEAKNRILRKYPDRSEYFIRVQFSDEDGRDLFLSGHVSLEPIYSRFKEVLRKGIPIAGRMYRFLGFSHSSLRSRSLWLSAPFIYNGLPQLARNIITSLGKFDQIRSPARCAARIGQAFSETPYAVSLDENGILVCGIPDVERNGRVFSDGVGTISWDAAEAIWDILPGSKRNSTCFQIRWAGAKGMLSLDTRLRGRQICIRESMTKFESDDVKILEICDIASKPIPLVLNRQVVKILEDMGAPDSWFLELQEKELNRLRGITANVYNTSYFLESQSIGQAMHLPRFLRNAESMGANYWCDPFLRSAVEAAVLKQLRLVKHKARIPVRQGMTLFGVMDETGYLQQGQVYVHFNTMKGRHDHPPGPVKVIVTRSPALHPGDVQLAENVIPPKDHPLAELKNCIVFSQLGERDLPSQLSGGDLDGDVFNVVWDPDLVDMIDSTFQPAQYPRAEIVELDRAVEAEDMANFFIDFMKTDHLGQIATRHMVLADQRDEGTLDADCLLLAELHSSAVDFSKTGKPVAIEALPKSDKARPDFMASGPWVKIQAKTDIQMDKHLVQADDDDDDGEGPRFSYYQSEKLLGKLYRAVDEQMVWAEDVKRVISNGEEHFWDILHKGIWARARKLLGRPISETTWEHRCHEAKGIRDVYEDRISEVTMDFSEHPSKPLTELEVFVGFVLDKTGVQSTRQRDRSIKLKDEFDRITTWITKQIRNPVSDSGNGRKLDGLELCLACLSVGCRKDATEEQGNYSRRSMDNIESFRVVAASALLRELNLLESRARERETGGYVGVRGNAGGFATATTTATGRSTPGAATPRSEVSTQQTNGTATASYASSSPSNVPAQGSFINPEAQRLISLLYAESGHS